MSIVIMFAVSSLPFLGSIIPELRSRGAAEQVVESLRTARQNAIGTTAVYRVIFTTTSIQIICTNGVPAANSCPANRPPDTTETVISEGATFAASPAEIRFDPKGATLTGAGNIVVNYPSRPVLARGREHRGPGPRLRGNGSLLMIMRRDAGISLVELMVALLLLGVSLMGLAAAFVPGRMAIQSGDQSTTATFLARRVLEDMRNRAYDAGTDEITVADFPATTGYGAGDLAGYPNFRRTITIVNNTPMAGTKTVTVVIFYKTELRHGTAGDARDDLRAGELGAMAMWRHGRGERGTTIIEVAVGLAVAGVLVAGVLTLVEQAQKTYMHSAEATDLQQNVRVAMDRLTRLIQAAGVNPWNETWGGATANDPAFTAFREAGRNCIRVYADLNGDHNLNVGGQAEEADENVYFHWATTAGAALFEQRGTNAGQPDAGRRGSRPVRPRRSWPTGSRVATHIFRYFTGPNDPTGPPAWSWSRRRSRRPPAQPCRQRIARGSPGWWSR